MTIFKEVREKNRATQQEMADHLEIPLRRYRSYEHGLRVPSWDVVVKILWMRNKGKDRELAKILNDLIKDGWYDRDVKL